MSGRTVVDVITALLAGLGTGLALIVAIGSQNAYLLRLAVSARLRVVVAAVVICAASDAVLILAGTLGVGAAVERFPVLLVVVRFVGAAFLLTYGVLAARRAVIGSAGSMRVDSEADAALVPAPTTTNAELARDSDWPTGLGAPGPEGVAEAETRPRQDADRTAAATTRQDGDRTAAATTRQDGDRTAAATARQDGVPTAAATGRHDATRMTASAMRPTAGRAAVSETGAVPPGRAPGVPTTRAAVVTMLLFTWANPHVYLDTLVFLGSVANQQGPELRWWWVVGAITASCLWFAGVGLGGRSLRPVFARPGAWRVFDACIAVVMLAFGVKLLLGA